MVMEGLILSTMVDEVTRSITHLVLICDFNFYYKWFDFTSYYEKFAKIFYCLLKQPNVLPR